jgi:multisubunit Na+/H+ antiporter MnhG subunit
MTALGYAAICIIVAGALCVLVGALGLCKSADKADRKLGYK